MLPISMKLTFPSKTKYRELIQNVLALFFIPFFIDKVIVGPYNITSGYN